MGIVRVISVLLLQQWMYPSFLEYIRSYRKTNCFSVIPSNKSLYLSMGIIEGFSYLSVKELSAFLLL